MDDTTKVFKLINEYKEETAQLTLSLDIIYHLVEDHVFDKYMYRLFNSATEYVIIYSSNMNTNEVNQPVHVRHRKFSEWVNESQPTWRLCNQKPNKYPYINDTKTGSGADFYIYERV